MPIFSFFLPTRNCRFFEMTLRNFTVCLLCLLSTGLIYSQSAVENNSSSSLENLIGTAIPRPNTVVIKRAEVFPQSWLGEYAGTLIISKAQGVVQEVPMRLIIKPTDSANIVTWNIIYGADSLKGLRGYVLRTVDSKKGLYILDEKNSIAIESYLIGNKLFNNYAVEGNALLTTTEKLGDSLVFEIIFGKEAPVSTTGGEKVKEENIPLVKSFPVLLNQKAVLKKL